VGTCVSQGIIDRATSKPIDNTLHKEATSSTLWLADGGMPTSENSVMAKFAEFLFYDVG